MPLAEHVRAVAVEHVAADLRCRLAVQVHALALDDLQARGSRVQRRHAAIQLREDNPWPASATTSVQKKTAAGAEHAQRAHKARTQLQGSLNGVSEPDKRNKTKFSTLYPTLNHQPVARLRAAHAVVARGLRQGGLAPLLAADDWLLPTRATAPPAP